MEIVKKYTSVEEAESDNMVKIKGEEIPFGHINKKWEKFKMRIKKTDRLVLCKEKKKEMIMAFRKEKPITRRSPYTGEIINHEDFYLVLRIG